MALMPLFLQGCFLWSTQLSTSSALSASAPNSWVYAYSLGTAMGVGRQHSTAQHSTVCQSCTSYASVEESMKTFCLDHPWLQKLCVLTTPLCSPFPVKTVYLWCNPGSRMYTMIKCWLQEMKRENRFYLTQMNSMARWPWKWLDRRELTSSHA